MAIDLSFLNTINSFNTLNSMLGSLNQIESNALTASTQTSFLGSLLNIEQNSIFLTAALAGQQSLNLSALNLRNATEPLNATSPTSIFNQTSATSSNANAVTATTLENATPGVFQVDVTQLAQGETVAGLPVNALAPTGITDTNGFGQLEFNIGGNVQTVTFQLNGSETNQEAFNTIAQEFNGRDLGVTASVTVNQAGNVALNLTGQAGAANAFTVTDILGNAAAFTGVGNPANATQSAQNAIFTVNGAGFTEATNQPTLANTGIQLNLLQTTGATPVSITVGANTENATTAVNNFVNAFNNTLSNLSSSISPTTQANATNLANLARENAVNLQNIGITVGAEGTLTVNQTQLQTALTTRPEDINAAFNGSGQFALGVQMTVEDIINQALSSTGGLSFTNFFNSGLQSIFNTNSLLAANLGLFFNSTF